MGISFQNYCYTLFFTRSKDAGALGDKSSSSLPFQYLYNIKVHLTIHLAIRSGSVHLEGVLSYRAAGSK